MAQGYDKYELDNQTGQSFRFALNDILEAAATQNSGDNSPNTTNTSYPYQVWVDTTNDIVKIRDAATAGSWYSLYSVDSDGKPTGAVSYGSYTIATNDTAGTGGTTAITVDTSQNVGIGTATPSKKLEIAATSAEAGIALSSSGRTLVMTSHEEGGVSQATKIGTTSNHELRIITNDTERMRVDTSGFVGIGATSPSHELHIAGSGDTRALITSGGSGDAAMMFENASGNTWGHGIDVSSGNYVIAYNASGDPSLSTQGVLNIDSSGNLGLGTTSPYNAAGYASMTLDDTSGGQIRFRTGGTEAGLIYNESSYFNFYAFGSNTLRYWTNGSVRMEVGGTGIVGMNSNVSGSYKLFVKNGASTTTDKVIHSELNSGSNNVNASHLYAITQSAGVWRLTGNGTSTFTSDERKKKNIETTRDGYLEDLRDLRVVKYNWHNQEDGTPKELGLIAQEVEQVFPGLVTEEDAPMEGDDYNLKSIKGSVLPFMLLKALQEAAEKIETLEAKVAALESA